MNSLPKELLLEYETLSISMTNLKIEQNQPGQTDHRSSKNDNQSGQNSPVPQPNASHTKDAEPSAATPNEQKESKKDDQEKKEDKKGDQKQEEKKDNGPTDVLSGAGLGNIVNKIIDGIGDALKGKPSDDKDNDNKASKESNDASKSSAENNGVFSGSGLGNVAMQPVEKGIEGAKKGAMAGASGGAGGAGAEAGASAEGPAMSSQTGESKKGANLGAWVKAAMTNQNEKREEEEYEMAQNQRSSGMRPSPSGSPGS